jgi:preprotein translocase subunit YajC
MNDLTRGRTVGPAGGVIGENAKIKPATVIQVIRINLNRSNEIFTYQKLYLKSVHKFRQLRRVVGAAGGQRSEKAKKKSATEGRLMPSI